jgi:hypothetical protein
VPPHDEIGGTCAGRRHDERCDEKSRTSRRMGLTPRGSA